MTIKHWNEISKNVKTLKSELKNVEFLLDVAECSGNVEAIEIYRNERVSLIEALRNLEEATGMKFNVPTI